MAGVTADDQWPSLPPIRTTASSSSDATDPYRHTHIPPSQPFHSHRSSHAAAGGPASASAPSSPPRHAGGSSRPSYDQAAAEAASAPCSSSYGSTKKGFSCANLLGSCFCSGERRQSRRGAVASSSPDGGSSTPWHRRGTPRCTRRRRYKTWRSMALLLIPAGGFSYPSTPTTKSQLFGTPPFPRTLSGKSMELHSYTSPRTPATSTALDHSQLSAGRSSQFPSPRTPASTKVQHFSGSIPSPRAPFYGAVSADAAASRTIHSCRKPISFSLAMPPGISSTVDRKKASFHQQPTVEEPSSPHVTCIGRVRQQSQCKKLLHTDTIDPRPRRRQDRIADLSRRKGAPASKLDHSFPADDDPLPRATINLQRRATGSCSAGHEQPLTEASIQRFGRGKLLNLHRIHSNKRHQSIAANELCDISDPGGDKITAVASTDAAVEPDLQAASDEIHDPCMNSEYDDALENEQAHFTRDTTECTSKGSPTQCNFAGPNSTELQGMCAWNP